MGKNGDDEEALEEDIDVNGFFKEQSTPRKSNSSPIEVN